MRDAARYYRESAVRGATPIGLIVILYDEIVRSLRKAQQALSQSNIETRSKTLTHVVEVIGYLQSVLDFEKGGEVARNLSQLYDLTRAKVVEINAAPTHHAIESLAHDFSRMSAAWRQAESTLTPAATAPNANRATKSVRSEERAEYPSSEKLVAAEL